MSAADFSTRVLAWFARHGRHDLPWQTDVTPYRVWVSEIMLQQTRVATVIPYYERFLSRFPGVQALADADLDQVLHYWSGLGYYARARHLHAAAGIIRDHHAGQFPSELATLQALPGVGRSTAGAILALAAGQRHPILDGNVKRVLARFHALQGWPGQAAVQKTLWELAERYTPRKRVSAYTQAMMDLGATLCTRIRPACARCPLAADCRACATGRQAEFPSPRPGKSLPVRSTRMLLLCNERNEVLLERRPPAGIWGGLWSFPEPTPDAALEAWCRAHLGMPVYIRETWPVVRHSFSHFHLEITPLLATAATPLAGVGETPGRLWYNTGCGGERGFAAPVERLLRRLSEQQTVR
jgi:A/G-specific adenine glycosylase